MEILKFKESKIDKIQLKTDIENIKDLVNNGQMDALDVLFRVNQLESAIKEIAALKKDLLQPALTEFDRNKDGKELVAYGSEITVVERSAGLDYEQDAEYKQLKEQLKEREQLLKDAYKLAEKGKELVIDGEVIPVVSVKSSGSTYFKFKSL